MSDQERDRKPKRPAAAPAGDDPWAKWRQPDATAPVAAKADVAAERTVRPERAAKPAAVVRAPQAKDAWAPKVEAKPEPVATTPFNPDGTLGVKRLAVAPGRTPNRKPLRGGPQPRKVAPRPNSPIAVEPETVRPVAVAPQRSGPPPEGTRLSKVMSERGLCSRREADLWIERGWVFVDGQQISELGTRIDPQAEISITKEAQKDQAKQVTILLNKPVGYVSGQPEPGFTPAITLISAASQLVQSGDPEFKPWMLRNLAPSGRLDIDSTGLLVLTQDGRVAKKLIGDDSQVEKEYLVRVEGELIRGGLDLLNHGLELDGKPLKPARVKQLNEDQLHFILKEGKKRQIRRMCELVGLRVTGLKRVRIGRVKLGDLQLGQWRFLRADESF